MQYAATATLFPHITFYAFLHRASFQLIIQPNGILLVINIEHPKFKEVPFEDRLGMLVDIEYSNRKNNRQKQLIRNAGFDQPEANIMDINYTSGRKLNKDLINRLATCEYVS